jgi:hypothetical protein
MTDLLFVVTDARPAAQTASPAIVLRVHVTNGGDPIHALALRCQAQIEPRARRHSANEQGRLYELFGDSSQWDRALKSVTWAQVSTVVPAFDREVDVDLPIPCTYDFEVAAAKYLHAVREGDIPLRLLFSGTAFSVREEGFRIQPVSWMSEASFRMPARVWRAAMDRFFPEAAWIRVRRDTLDRLQVFKGRHALITWDEALDMLLQEAGAKEAV